MNRPLALALGAALLATYPAYAATVITGDQFEDSGQSECSDTRCSLTLSAAPTGKKVTLIALDCEFFTANLNALKARVSVADLVRSGEFVPQGVVPISPELGDLKTAVMHFTTPLEYTTDPLSVSFEATADGSGLRLDLAIRCLATGKLTPL